LSILALVILSSSTLESGFWEPSTAHLGGPRPVRAPSTACAMGSITGWTWPGHPDLIPRNRIRPDVPPLVRPGPGRRLRAPRSHLGWNLERIEATFPGQTRIAAAADSEKALPVSFVRPFTGSRKTTVRCGFTSRPTTTPTWSTMSQGPTIWCLTVPMSSPAPVQASWRINDFPTGRPASRAIKGHANGDCRAAAHEKKAPAPNHRLVVFPGGIGRQPRTISRSVRRWTATTPPSVATENRLFLPITGRWQTSPARHTGPRKKKIVGSRNSCPSSSARCRRWFQPGSLRSLSSTKNCLWFPITRKPGLSRARPNRDPRDSSSGRLFFPAKKIRRREASYY